MIRWESVTLKANIYLIEILHDRVLIDGETAIEKGTPALHDPVKVTEHITKAMALTPDEVALIAHTIERVWL